LAAEFTYFSFELVAGISVGNDLGIVLCTNEDQARTLKDIPQGSYFNFEKHKEIRKSSHYRDLVQPAFLKALGNMEGLSLVDLGCGDGFHTGMI
jgi:hypothetical protein